MAGTAAACVEDEVLIQVDETSVVRFRVAVADTIAERGQGLMNVESMPTSVGMLFVYQAEQSVSFWMRNTLIPLDMIFMDGSGTIVSVHENAIPLDETPIFGGDSVQYVLEINGGLSAQLGIDAGDVLQHPSIDQKGAAFPCGS
ncbi:DUF192 domain-containing protein [Shimia ponticola]|uniref:DUF192 domain-containing protein n=1 Tax=Shimia ponticola TaxID=2582893 RepID=UPI0011BEFC75|nr:DUF192 domain-containing protein [Shimia ponticola]